MHKLTAIIIDDMKLARATLRADLEMYCPEIQIIGEAESVISGAKLLKQNLPDILFLDIDLTDGVGFDLLEMVDEPECVIFTTASEDYAIQAFKVNAVDYLLKPIDPALLQKAVQRCIKTFDNSTTIKDSNKLSLHTVDDIQIVRIDTIVRMESDGNYTSVFLDNGTKLLVCKSIKAFEKLLQTKGFIRTHQSHLVSLEKVSAYVKSDGGYLAMTDKSQVPVSIRKKAMVINTLENMTL